MRLASQPWLESKLIYIIILQISTNLARLIIVHQSRGFETPNFKLIQSDLDSMIYDFIPFDCTNKDNIPYMTMENKIGEVYEVYKSQRVLINDYKDVDDSIIREYLLRSKLSQVKDQAKIIIRKISKKNKKYLNSLKQYHLQSSSPFVKVMQEASQKPQQYCVLFDQEILVSLYQRMILTGLAYIYPQISDAIDKKTNQCNLLALGAGVGSFTSFISNNFKNSFNILGVQCDKEIIDIGQKYFNSRCQMVDLEKVQQITGNKICLDNPIQYILQPRNITNKWDAIIIDLNNGSGDEQLNIEKLFTQETLEALKMLMAQEHCIVLINLQVNLQSNNKKLIISQQDIYLKVDKIFKNRTVFQTRQCQNKIIILSNKTEEQFLSKQVLKRNLQKLQKKLEINLQEKMKLSEILKL